MERYWERHPPVGDLVAAYLGYEPPRRADEPREHKPEDYCNLQELIAGFAAIGGQVKHGN